MDSCASSSCFCCCCCCCCFFFFFFFLIVPSGSTASSAFSCNNATCSGLPSLFPAVSSSSDHVWPDLTFNWRSVLGSLTGFIGAALGSAGGVGGGSIFIPTANLIIGFDAKTSTALSKCMIMGAALSTVIYNIRLKHPQKDCPLIDYDLALLVQPMLLLGISIGVIFNVIFPTWAITFLLVFIMIGTGSRVFQKAVKAWEKETAEKRMQEGLTTEKQTAFGGENTALWELQETGSSKSDENACWRLNTLEEASGLYEPLDGDKNSNVKTASAACEDSTLDTLRKNIQWRSVAVLGFVWMMFLILQTLQSHTQTCSMNYWILSFFQVPVAILAFLASAFKLYRMNNQQDAISVLEHEARPLQYHPLKLAISAIVSTIGGLLAGMVGLGGGFALGPMLLEFGVEPQVLSATATFAMLFSSSLSVAEYYLLHRFPVPYALYLFAVSVIGGFSGQHVMQSLIKLLGRASIIVFLLTFLTVMSAVFMGALGLVETIESWKLGENMGFTSLC